MKRLSSSHIDSVSQGSDDKSRTVTEVLITVSENGISNLEDVIADVAIPIALELGLPLELVSLDYSFDLQLLDDITRMGVHGDHAHNLLTHSCGEFTLHHSNEVVKELNLELVASGHRIAFKGGFDSLYPVDEVDQEGDLCGVILKPVSLLFLSEALKRVCGNVFN